MGTKRQRSLSSNRGMATPTEPCVHSILSVKCLSAPSDQLSPRCRRRGEKKPFRAKEEPGWKESNVFRATPTVFLLLFPLMTLVTGPEVHLVQQQQRQRQLTECSKVIKVSLLWCWSLLLSQWPFLLENLPPLPLLSPWSCLLSFLLLLSVLSLELLYSALSFKRSFLSPCDSLPLSLPPPHLFSHHVFSCYPELFFSFFKFIAPDFISSPLQFLCLLTSPPVSPSLSFSFLLFPAHPFLWSPPPTPRRCISII